MADSTTLTIACLCGASRFTTTVAKSSLPLSTHFCNCNTCRHIGGALSYSKIEWPEPPPSTETLTAYHFSGNVTAYFCSTCGSPVISHDKSSQQWAVSTGLLQHSDEMLSYGLHQFVDSTKDGGFSDWLRLIDDKLLPRWSAAEDTSTNLSHGWKHSSRTTSRAELRAHCLCEGVDFRITRPDERSIQFKAPLPDVIQPYKSMTKAEKSRAEVDDPGPWWSTKHGCYKAGTCACNSCRLAAGVSIVQWAFVPSVNIKLANGEPFRPLFGTLKAYDSSSNAKRYFCRCCGASVFWIGNDRPELIDVAVGILDSESGARAEDWLDWITTRVSFEEDAIHRRLVTSFQDGLRAWGRNKQKESASD